MTLSSQQRQKALALAGKGVSRADVARCIGFGRAELDSAVGGDIELCRAFGVGRKAVEPSRSYSELTSTCPAERASKHLATDGITVDLSVLGSLRARCRCGTAMAVIQAHERGVSWGEIKRIKQHLLDCRSCPPIRKCERR